jgi:hypothetical protein
VDWLDAGRTACRAIVARADEDDTDTSPGQLLLTDVRKVLMTDFMASAELCAELRRLPESPWGDESLTVHRIGRMLGGYNIKSGHSADKKRRGYYVRDFADAWSRYLPPEIASKASEPSRIHAEQRGRPVASPDANTSPDDTQVSGAGEASRRNSSSTEPSDGSDGSFKTCSDCGHQLGQHTGKCSQCILQRAAAATRHEPTEGEAA